MKRRWYKFSLLTLFVVVTGWCVFTAFPRFVLAYVVTVVASFMACVLLCGCQPADARIQNEPLPVNNEPPDMFRLSETVLDRYEKIGYDKLSRPETVFFCVWGLEAQVNNGGFDQYYFNTSGDHAIDVTKALEAIGAKHTADLVRQANALFGVAGPSPNQIARQNQLDVLGEAETKKLHEIEEEFFKYKDKLGPLLEEYVSKHADAFRRAN